jgi:hypothetical protein
MLALYYVLHLREILWKAEINTFFPQFVVLRLPFRSGAVVHSCNPRYFGGRDQEDYGLKPAWTKS